MIKLYVCACVCVCVFVVIPFILDIRRRVHELLPLMDEISSENRLLTTFSSQAVFATRQRGIFLFSFATRLEDYIRAYVIMFRFRQNNKILGAMAANEKIDLM